MAGQHHNSLRLRAFEVCCLWQSDLTGLNGLEFIFNHIRMQERVYQENPHIQNYQMGLTAKHRLEHNLCTQRKPHSLICIQSLSTVLAILS